MSYKAAAHYTIRTKIGVMTPLSKTAWEFVDEGLKSSISFQSKSDRIRKALLKRAVEIQGRTKEE